MLASAKGENTAAKIDGNERIDKVKRQGVIDELYKCIADSIPIFLNHNYIKLCQWNFYNEIKDSLIENPSIKMLKIDFAENYTTKRGYNLPKIESLGGRYKNFC